MLLFLNNNNSTFLVECVSTNADGFITVKVWDNIKRARYKAGQAHKDAIYTFLYLGVSGSTGCATQPPILNNPAEKENFKAIEKRFFSKKGDWSIFTRSSSIQTTLPTNVGSKNWKVYQVSISKNELRKYLEEQKIIKKLNDIF